MEKVDELLKELAILSKYKFLVHKKKGDWAYKTFDVLLEQLKAEVQELEQEIRSKEFRKEKALSEIGDIVNYCVMLLDKVNKV